MTSIFIIIFIASGGLIFVVAGIAWLFSKICGYSIESLKSLSNDTPEINNVNYISMPTALGGNIFIPLL